MEGLKDTIVGPMPSFPPIAKHKCHSRVFDILELEIFGSSFCSDCLIYHQQKDCFKLDRQSRCFATSHALNVSTWTWHCEILRGQSTELLSADRTDWDLASKSILRLS